MSTTAPAKPRFYETPGLAAAALLAGVLLVFQPAEIYATNEGSLFYGFAQLCGVLVPAFAVVFLALFGLARAGSARWRRSAEATLAALVLACWAGASFFTASRGSMDGATLLRLATPAQAWINAACHAVLLGVGAVAMWRWPPVMRRLLAALFAVLAAYAAWIAVSEDKPWRAAPVNERLGTFSTERNVLVVLLDTLQSDFFAEVVRDDPQLARAFDGFTYFPNAVGSAPTTYLSMPTIHSGVRVTSGSGIRALYRENVVEQSFVAKLASAGYDAVLVNPVVNACPRGAACDHIDQLVYGRAAALAGHASFRANLALFRAVPHVLKPAVYRDGKWWTPWNLFADAIASNLLLEKIARETKPGAARPTVRFLHLFNTHAPARVDADCHAIEGAPWNRPAAIAQAHCGLSRVALLLSALRRTGTYDASAIVLLADHGAGLPGESTANFPLGASASPMLLVKPFGAHGPMASSTQVVGLADLPATVCGMTRGCTVTAGTNILAGGARPGSFSFITYEWSHAAFGADSVPVLDRYEIAGPPADQKSWKRLAPALPPRPLTRLAFAKSDPAAAFGDGWSGFEANAEKDWRWAVGKQSDVRLRLEEPADMRLQLDVWTHPGNKDQAIRVQVNGTELGELPVGLTPGRVELAVPRSALRAGDNAFVFHYRSAGPPSAADARPLAVLFEEMALVPAR